MVIDVKKCEEDIVQLWIFFGYESELERKRGFVVNRRFVNGWKYEDKSW